MGGKAKLAERGEGGVMDAATIYVTPVQALKAVRILLHLTDAATGDDGLAAELRVGHHTLKEMATLLNEIRANGSAALTSVKEE